MHYHECSAHSVSPFKNIVLLSWFGPDLARGEALTAAGPSENVDYAFCPWSIPKRARE
jgi:hypothetical protein